MINEIKDVLFEQGADVVRFVDISSFPKEQTLGFEKAILFCMVLSKEYIIDSRNDKPIDWENDEYLLKEHMVEKLADWLADYIHCKGFQAHSQSGENNKRNGYIEQAYIDPELQEGISVIPQKAVARVGGLGFIGKSNLFVTEEYGSAIVMCSVLTNAPVLAESYPLVESKCGSCKSCVENCPANALLGNEWTVSGGRESVVDVSKCCCALKCMVYCPWTVKYANGNT